MDEFKVGDEVEVCEYFRYSGKKLTDSVRWLGVIKRETATQWVVAHQRASDSVSHFRKADGRQIGVSGSGSFYRYLRRREKPTAATAPQP